MSKKVKLYTSETARRQGLASMEIDASDQQIAVETGLRNTGKGSAFSSFSVEDSSSKNGFGSSSFKTKHYSDMNAYRNDLSYYEDSSVGSYGGAFEQASRTSTSGLFSISNDDDDDIFSSKRKGSSIFGSDDDDWW